MLLEVESGSVTHCTASACPPATVTRTLTQAAPADSEEGTRTRPWTQSLNSYLARSISDGLDDIESADIKLGLRVALSRPGGQGLLLKSESL